MDTQLTPSKIERLINLAQGCPTQLQNFVRRDLLGNLDEKQLESLSAISVPTNKSNNVGESSSGILDLDNCEGFGDSCTGPVNKSTSFFLGEITGRSTGTNDLSSNTLPNNNFKDIPHSEQKDVGNTWSNNIVKEMITKLNKQSCDIHEIMRNSIASGYSFQSQRDLTADEVSLVNREAALPVLPKDLNLNLTRNIDLKDASQASGVSVGAYFQNRCTEFNTIFPKTDSPKCDYSRGPNLLEGDIDISQCDTSNKNPTLDTSLDSIPTRQPRVVNSTPYDTYIPTQLFPSKVSPAPPPIPPIPTSDKIILMHPTIFCDPSKQHLTLQTVNEESSQEESSFSISAIAKHLVNESDARPSAFMNQLKNDKKGNQCKKDPLSEVEINIIEKKLQALQDNLLGLNLNNVQRTEKGNHVAATEVNASNKDLRNNKENVNSELPAVVISRYSTSKTDMEIESAKSDYSIYSVSKSTASKSNKTPSTCNTVQENLVSTSFRSGDSPLQTNKTRDEHNISHIASPNVQYKELDNSVDWQEVMNQRRSMLREGLAKASEDWTEITVNSVNGFVGVRTEVIVSVKTLTDSWLTARLDFDKTSYQDSDIIIDLPRFPVLLSPIKLEQFVISLTLNVEMKTSLKFTLTLKDASIDMEVEQNGSIDIDFKMPMLQTITNDGVNNGITFSPTQENSVTKKTLLLVSDCPADILLDLAVLEGRTMFSISHVQEIKRAELKTSLSENYQNVVNNKNFRHKLKPTNKQSCRLSNGNGIRAVISFTAPKLSDLELNEKQATFNGSLSVYIIGTNALLRRIDLAATVGTANLLVKSPLNKIHLGSEPTMIKLTNTGTVVGIWATKFKDTSHVRDVPFKVCSNKLEIHPNTTVNIKVQYTGLDDEYNESVLIFQDVINGSETQLILSGGKEVAKSFPIKSTLAEMAWVREGRKEINLKNYSDKKVTIKCKIIGGGFIMETPKATGTDLLLTFGPNECRDICIIFEPTSSSPHKAKLMILTEHGGETGKSVRLHGCAGGGAARWAGLVTYGDTALVRARARLPVDLALYNRSREPAFISARVHFNLQYAGVAGGSELAGARAVVRGRGAAALALRVAWARVERAARGAGAAAAASLATVSVLTGAECTRRRILRILKEENNGKLDVSKLSDPLQRLVGPFEGEDPTMDDTLNEFQETKKSLEVLMTGLQELTAQIDLPQDFADRTIVLTDDTVLEHHTLCD